MNEEEKKAIERANFLIKIDTYLEKEMLINLLHLIEQQQKEIEDLKEIDKHITKETVEFVNSHYIHKDKIIELLNKDVGQYMKFYRDIEELLEE